MSTRRLTVKDGVFPPLNAKARAQLEALRKVRDEDIDFSDIPPLTETFWQNAVPLRLLTREMKKAMVERLKSGSTENK